MNYACEMGFFGGGDSGDETFEQLRAATMVWNSVCRPAIGSANDWANELPTCLGPAGHVHLQDCLNPDALVEYPAQLSYLSDSSRGPDCRQRAPAPVHAAATGCPGTSRAAAKPEPEPRREEPCAGGRIRGHAVASARSGRFK